MAGDYQREHNRFASAAAANAAEADPYTGGRDFAADVHRRRELIAMGLDPDKVGGVGAGSATLSAMGARPNAIELERVEIVGKRPPAIGELSGANVRIDTRIPIIGPAHTKPDGSPATYSYDNATGDMYWDLGDVDRVTAIPKAFRAPTVQELTLDPSNPWTQGPRLGNVLGDFGATTATAVAGMFTGGWTLGALRGTGLLTAGGAAGLTGDLTTQVLDNGVFIATKGQYGRFGFDGSELALSVGLGALPGVPGAVRGLAEDLRGIGVPDWRIQLASPKAGTLYSNPLSIEMERIGGPQMFPNQLPQKLAAEMRVASRLGVEPISVSHPYFAEVANSGTIKWAVNESGDLLVVPHTVGDTEIAHSVLTGGRPVLAAGQAEVAAGGGKLIGVGINTHSGHYLNGADDATNATVEALGRAAFLKHGISFPPLGW